MISRKSNDILEASRRQALIAAIGLATQAFQRSTDAFDDVVARRLRLNRTDLRCLDWLFDGPKTAGQLAAATGLSSAATTTLLDRLERRGLVRRMPCPDDGRGAAITLTDRGRTVLERAAPRHVESVRRNFIDLLTPAEVDTLSAIAEKVTARLGGETR